jgi:hypothetical protein
MKTVPIAGTLKSVSFFEDDTIETVRQLIALAVGSHPDRLFLEVKGSFPKETYSSSPKAWTDLFFRMSYDGTRILPEVLKTYATDKRVGLAVTPSEIGKEDWESHTEALKPIFDPEREFEEWRILGVPEAQSFVLPLPPQDLRALPATRIPIAQGQSLFETLHPYDVSEFRVTVVDSKPSELVKRVYFPGLRPDTPINIESLRATLEGNQRQLQQLLDLDTPKHQTTAIVRAKWYIPLQSTKFAAPRTRFEQIFYGMTVTESLPYIGYFTAKTETMRHKFYVTDPKTKTPILDTSMWKGWLANTQPQRRRPTLLLYRGTARNVFDRIAITDKDITVDVRREKDSTSTLEELQAEMTEWMKEFDALLPFLVKTDVDVSRWELSDLAVVAGYSTEIREFDMHRFSCLQTLFGFQNDTFRLLRAEHSSEDISPQELQAFQILNQEDAERTPAYLAKELNLPESQALELFQRVTSLSEDLNLERSLKAYPTLKFAAKEVILKFVTNLDRTLRYADILRFVLTSDSESVDAVCPRRMEKVPAKATVPQQELQIEAEFSADDDFNALLGFGGEPEEAPAPAEEAPAEAPKPKKVKVTSRGRGTYNYFNSRLQKFDPATFDESFYPSKCDKNKQVVALTPEDKARMGPEYDYSNAPAGETMELEDPEATVICPPYWCMRDELPLREDQLVEGDDGAMHCPVCNGKVRETDTSDTIEFPVIPRDAVHKYPNFMKKQSTINNRKVPCCYKSPRAGAEIIAPKEDVSYVLDSSSLTIPGLRMAYVSPELASRLKIKTHYETSVRKGRLSAEESDVFRVGLGRPSKTLPVILGDKTTVKRPRDAPDNVKRCSFYRTWRGRAEGLEDRIVASIDDAYEQGKLSMLEELEYVTSFLKCEVILVDLESMQVTCGFWSETLGASSRTIAVLGSTILAKVGRRKTGSLTKPTYIADLRKEPFGETLPLLRELHTKACAINLPGLDDAIRELQAKSQTSYQVILDPFQRIQAVLVPRKVVLPIQPVNVKPDEGVPVKDGYKDVEDAELPTVAQQRAFVRASRHPGFRIVEEHTNINQGLVELRMASGFRVPVRVEAPTEEAPPREVIETIRRDGEEPLVDGEINEEDKKVAQDILYASEIREFLLFSLSKDIQTDDEADLRTAIETRDPNLYLRLKTWFKEHAYADDTESPVEFVNKVRTPCGQFTDKKACNSSSLCGWHKKVCKIRVKPIVDKKAVLRDLARTLLRNDKQRALVLDGRLSPFFSTVLYLEMPHEWITTSV